MSTIPYANWTDTLVAHTFNRLIACKHAHTNDKLTLDEFVNDVIMLKGYIIWRETHMHDHSQNKFTLYNFSSNSMKYFIDLIKYDMVSEEKTYLIKLWVDLMIL